MKNVFFKMLKMKKREKIEFFGVLADNGGDKRDAGRRDVFPRAYERKANNARDDDGRKYYPGIGTSIASSARASGGVSAYAEAGLADVA